MLLYHCVPAENCQNQQDLGADQWRKRGSQKNEVENVGLTDITENIETHAKEFGPLLENVMVSLKKLSEKEG